MIHAFYLCYIPTYILFKCENIIFKSINPDCLPTLLQRCLIRDLGGVTTPEVSVGGWVGRG